MMYLVQILLPLTDNDGERLPSSLFAETRALLVERFGGLTAYSRAPAQGLWQPDEGNTTRDELVIYEVMINDLDRSWWKQYRERLELQFRQESIVVRATQIEQL